MRDNRTPTDVCGEARANAPLIKKPKSRLLLIFSPDFTLNSQIRLFYAEKWIFLKKLGTLLNEIRNGYTAVNILGGYEREIDNNFPLNK